MEATCYKHHCIMNQKSVKQNEPKNRSWLAICKISYSPFSGLGMIFKTDLTLYSLYMGICAHGVLVLMASMSSKVLDEPGHYHRLSRAFASGIYKVWT